VIIYRGKIVADSTPAALKRSLNTGSVLRITLENASFSDVQATLSSLGGVSEVRDVTEPSNDKGTVTVRVTCDDAARSAISRKIHEQEWGILQLDVEENSMEDAFRALTGHDQVKGKIDGR
jgi:ABC-type multidrug transport system ATPase subunit